MEFIDVVKLRESTRKFSDEVVPEEVLTKILDVGRLAPTAKNYQPYKIFVFDTTLLATILYDILLSIAISSAARDLALTTSSSILLSPFTSIIW